MPDPSMIGVAGGGVEPPQPTLAERTGLTRPNLGLLAFGFAPLLLLFFANLWERMYYQFFPMAMAEAGFLGWTQLDREKRVIRDRSAWRLTALRERTRMSAFQLPSGGGFGKIQDAHGNAARLPVSRPRSARRPPCLNQPCTAWEGCRCRVYAGRPQYCHQFECALLKSGVVGR